MIALSTRSLAITGSFAALLFLSNSQLQAQTPNKSVASVVEGKTQDSDNHPVAAVELTLEGPDASRKLTSKADSQGQFRFEAVPPGSYTLRAKLTGYQDCEIGPFEVDGHETKSVVVFLTKEKTPGSTKDPASAIAFSDEPAFTVAGVTDTTAMGGHGSGPIVRNSSVLSKETAALANEPTSKEPAQEAAIRAALVRDDKADLHAQLAEIEESEGRPLEAVKEYERAAEMQPSEPHLFAWGAELLLHHAPEPAIEVFSKGHRLYPQSSRMMLGLGAAWYAQRSKEQAEQIFLQACDLNPADPTPYLFLGRLQVTEQVLPSGWTERMKRFVSLHPETAMAHYLYAVALTKGDRRPDNLKVAETELNIAIKLDPHLGDAYLELGILLSKREDFPGAVVALQKAAENTPIPDDAHYHLAQVYRRIGEAEKARQEIALYKQFSEQKNKQAERERHEIPQFVYTLREQNPASPPAVPDSH
jgi:tetratricopeptide (TPR) repeat protein